MDFSTFKEDSLLENIRIDNVFFVDLLNTCGSISGSFDDFYRSEYEEVIKVMGIDSNANRDYNFSISSDFSEYVFDNDIKGVILSFSTPRPSNFRFNNKGEFLSCSQNWGHNHLCVAYAQTLEDALHQAVKTQEDIFNDIMNEEKSKSGF